MDFEVRRIAGRFMHLDEGTLKMMILEMKAVLRSMGAVGPDELGVPVSRNLPLWMEAEFLDNVINIEMDSK